MYNIEKITDEEFDAMEKDYDPIEAPPGPYKIQPHNQGRVRNRFSKLNYNFGRYIFYLFFRKNLVDVWGSCNGKIQHCSASG